MQEASLPGLALPVEQARTLTSPLRDPALAPVQTMLSWFASDPALTLLAGYPLTTPDPGFDLLHPDDARVLQSVVHDSAKRSNPGCRTFVFHASSVWSRRHLEAPRDTWSAALLQAASTLLGDWVASPLWTLGLGPCGLGPWPLLGFRALGEPRGAARATKNLQTIPWGGARTLNPRPYIWIL